MMEWHGMGSQKLSGGTCLCRRWPGGGCQSPGGVRRLSMVGGGEAGVILCYPDSQNRRHVELQQQLTAGWSIQRVIHSPLYQLHNPGI